MRKRWVVTVHLLLCGLLLTGCLSAQGPVVTMSMEPSSGHGPLLVHLKAHTIAGMAHPISYEWDFGDGASAIGPVIDHEFAGKGTIPVRLVATDSRGRQTTIERTVRLLDRIPHAQFTYQPHPAPTHHPVLFDATSSYDPDGEIVSYHWDFGDGATAEGPVVKHEFQTPSITYRVVLTVTDDTGSENTMYRDIVLIGCDH